MANEDKAARYQRLRRRASLLDGAVQASFLLLLVVSGGSTGIRALVESFVGPSPPFLVTAYVIVLAAIHEVVRLPIAFYRGFVLERRYGLSTESPGRWLMEQLKAGVLVLLYVIVAAMVVTALLRTMPAYWWVAAAFFFAATLVLITHLAPVVLLPLFHDVRPLERDALRRRVLALVERARLPVLDVLEWRVGDRTTRANAALAGIGRTRRILLSDTLLAAHSDEEIEAVLAHELAHHVYGDIRSALALELVVLMLGFYAADRVLAAFIPLGLAGRGDVAALPLVALALGVVVLALTPLAHALSRWHERRADRYALNLTRNAEAFISAMRRLAATNLAEERPSRLVEILFHSHPSTTARIDAARRWTG